MKVTLAQIEACIAKVTYEIRDDRRTTVCEITLHNGWTERGESNCVDPAEFVAALGEKAAYGKAIDGLWKCFAFVLRDQIANAKRATPVARVARAIWNIRREAEDRCDMELEDMGDGHSVWKEANAALEAMKGA